MVTEGFRAFRAANGWGVWFVIGRRRVGRPVLEGLQRKEAVKMAERMSETYRRHTFGTDQKVATP